MTDTAYTALDSTSHLLVSLQSALHRNQKPIIWVDSSLSVHQMVKCIKENIQPSLEYYSVETHEGIKLHSLAISPYSEPIVIDLTGCDPENATESVTVLINTLPPRSVIIMPTHAYIKFRAIKQYREMFSIHWVARSNPKNYTATAHALTIGAILSVVYVCSVALLLGSSGGSILSIGAFLLLVIAGINVYLDSQDLSK